MADKPKVNAIAQLLGTRTAALQAVVMALLFGLGVNVLSSLLVLRFEKGSKGWLLVISIALIVIAVFWLYRRVFSSVCLNQRWEGVIGIEPGGSNSFIDLLVYPFSRDVHRLIQATFKGDAALLSDFRASKILSVSPEIIASRWYGKVLKPNNRLSVEQSNVATKLIEEATEVVVFYAISDSLTRYASRSQSVKWKYLRVADLTGIIESNRTLKKMGKDIDDGASYVVDSSGALRSEHKVMVPEGCKLSRQPSGEILLDTPRISISFKVEFPCVRHFELPEFSILYLNREPQNTELYKIFVSTQISIPTRKIWDISEWWEQEWMEELILELRERIDFSSFKERVNFEAALVARRLQVVYDAKKTQ